MYINNNYYTVVKSAEELDDVNELRRLLCLCERQYLWCNDNNLNWTIF